MLDQLLKHLAGDDMLVRAEAVNELRALADPRKLDGLAALARDPQADELGRRDAIGLINGEPGAAALKHLVEIALDGAARENTRARGGYALRARPRPLMTMSSTRFLSIGMPVRSWRRRTGIPGKPRTASGEPLGFSSPVSRHCNRHCYASL